MKMILRSFLTILSWGMCFHFASGQSDVSCPTTTRCYREPANCDSSANCNTIIYYEYKHNSSEMEITIGSRRKWVAFTQVLSLNTVTKMTNIRGEICFELNSNAQLASLTAQGNAAPTFRTTATGINLAESFLRNGGVVCRYRRLVTPPAASSSLYYDLTQPHHIVYASGNNVGSSYPSYHVDGGTGSTPNVVSFIPSDVSCPSNERCYRKPDGCTSSADCDIIIFYEYNSNDGILEVTLGTRRKWVGFSQVPTLAAQRMTGIRGEVCYDLNTVATLKSFTASGNSAPSFVDRAQGITLNEAVITSSGGVVCRYRRSVVPPAASTSLYYNLNQPHHIVYAFGTEVQSDNPSYHQSGNTFFTDNTVNFVPLADVSCPSNERCYRVPNGCTSSADCDAIIFYQYNSNNEEIEITIGTRLKWVGFTQVPTLGGDKMTNIRGEACYNLNSNARLVNLNASRNAAPTFRALNLVEGVTLTEAIITTTGGVVCRYRRLMTPPAASSSFYYNLNLPHHIVYAYGENVGSEFPSYHGGGKTGSTPNRITFLPGVAEVSCPSTERCYRTPNGCTSSADCDAIIFYQYNSNNEELQITIGSRLQWVGFTQARTLEAQKMTGIRGEVCFILNSVPQLASLTANANGPPAYRSSAPGITLTRAVLTTSGSVVCEYRRLVTPPAASASLYYNLNQPHHILYAYGSNVGSQYPSYHTRGRTGFTPNQINFIPEPSAVNLNGCGTSFSCQRMPEGCSPPSACDALAIFTYQTSASTIDIELITKNNWVGLGQKASSSGNRMVNIRGQYCLRRGSNVKFGNFNGNSLSQATTPAWVDTVAGVSLISSEIRSDGTISCKFRRPVEPAANNNNLYSLQNTVQSIVAFGNGESGGNPNYHGRGSYSSAVNVNYLVSSNVGQDAVDLEDEKKAHGILMIVAWMLLATCGIYMPRYMKPVLKDKKICGKAAWFPIHQITMLLCVATFIAGLIVILVHLDGKWSETAEAHHWLGLFTIIAGLLQPVMAVFRPNPDSEKRPIFNWAHRLVGVAAWLLGGLSIVYGLDITDQEYTPAIVFIVAAIVLYLALDLALIATRGKRSSAAVTYASRDGATAVEHQKNGAQQDGSYLQWLFLILVFALSIAMTSYHIYLVATAETGGSS